jgi:hypothetical protein
MASNRTYNALLVHVIKVVIIAGKKVEQPIELGLIQKFLYARFKAADSTIGALRDLKIEALLSSSSISAFQTAIIPMLKVPIERGRESSSRGSQSAEFMFL